MINRFFTLITNLFSFSSSNFTHYNAIRHTCLTLSGSRGVNLPPRLFLITPDSLVLTPQTFWLFLTLSFTHVLQKNIYKKSLSGVQGVVVKKGFVQTTRLAHYIVKDTASWEKFQSRRRSQIWVSSTKKWSKTGSRYNMLGGWCCQHLFLSTTPWSPR